MPSYREVIVDALEKKYEAQMAQAEANIKVYMENPVGVGEHPNIVHEVEKLLKFCSLDWDENCLNHHKNKRAIKTISFNQAREPIYKSSVKSFRVE